MKQTKTQQIFNTQCPYENKHQGLALKLLFVCSVGMLRSPTAQVAASSLGFNARACGSCTDLALIPLNCNLINWADKIIFMNMENYSESMKEFKPVGYDVDIKYKAVVWDISDDYDWGDQWLYNFFIDKLKVYLKRSKVIEDTSIEP